MLFKNNMTPAYAYAGYQESKSKSSKKNESVTLMASEDDDFENYTSPKSAPKKKPQPQSAKPRKKDASHKSSKKFTPLIIAIIAIIALVVIIAIIIAIINAPGSNMKKSDNVFLAYKGADNKYHLAINGEEKKDIVFDNEIRLEIAENNNFTYVFEKLPENEKIKIYIVKASDDRLKACAEADDIINWSTLEPCVIYMVKADESEDEEEKTGNLISCFRGDRDDKPITDSATASNFVIANNASCIYFTEGQTNCDLKKYSHEGTAQSLNANGFIPKYTSPDGRYLYGIHEANRTLHYIDTKKITEDKTTVGNIKFSAGTFDKITAINKNGNQIIFATTVANGKLNSYFYELGDETATPLKVSTGAVEGTFTSIHPDPKVIYEDSLLDSFFIVENKIVTDDEDDKKNDKEENTATTKKSTYFISKKKELVRLADTEGKFSPNGKHFYYINSENKLKRISLSSRKFDTHESITSVGKVEDFVITQKGDIYTFSDEGGKTTDGCLSIRFYDSADPSPIPISDKADPESIWLSVNTLYFAETTTSGDGQASTKVYSSTDGSNKSGANFDNELTKAPISNMGSGKKGYAYVINESNSEVRIYYTSNGKKFETVCNGYLLNEEPSSKNQ